MAQFRHLSSGKVHVVVRRKGHEPVYGTFPNKTIAKAWAQDVERKMWEKTYLPTRQLDRVPFAILAEDFEGHIVSRTRGHASAHSRLNTLRSSFGEIPIGQITPEQVIDYVDKRLQAITSEMLRKELTLFSRVFRYAIRIKLPLPENPVALAREELALTKSLKAGRERNRRMSDADIDRLEAASRSVLLPSIVRFIVQGLTAMRRGEVVNMRRGHLEGTTLKIPETKTDQPRVIPLNDVALGILESLAPRADGFVWGIRADSITQAFARAAKRVGLVEKAGAQAKAAQSPLKCPTARLASRACEQEQPRGLLRRPRPRKETQRRSRMHPRCSRRASC